MNDLLAQGKTVGMVTEGANKGDFVVSYDTFSSVADQYVLVAARVSEVPAAQAISQPTLFLPCLTTQTSHVPTSHATTS